MLSPAIPTPVLFFASFIFVVGGGGNSGVSVKIVRAKESKVLIALLRQWAPQVAVLSYESMGGTRCLKRFGVECRWFGWPLYAEQRLNRTVSVEETKLALGLNYSADGFVSTTELEKRVREFVYSEVGTEVRERVSDLL